MAQRDIPADSRASSTPTGDGRTAEQPPPELEARPAAAPRPGYPAAGYGYGYGYGADGMGDEVHLADYLRVLYKHRWMAFTAFVLVVLSTAVYTFTATPIYEATVQILIEAEDPNVVNFQEVLEQAQRTNEYYQTQYRILESRALARRTLDSLKLWAHPQFSREAAERQQESGWSPSAIFAAPVDAVSDWLTGWLAPAPARELPGAGETVAQAEAIDRFLSHLTVSPVRNSRLVDVKFRSPDPQLAANIANSLARNYIEQNLELRLQSSKEATDWLAQQLAEQRRQVEASERALQEYRERNDAVSLEDRQNIVVQKLADLNAAVTRARTERIQKEAAYNQIRAVQNNRAALDTLPAIVSNTFIQNQKAELAELQRQQAQMSERLGPKHPDMLKITLAIEAAQARIDAEIAKVVESLRNDYQQALAQERELAAALDQQKREALDLNRKGIEYGVLARDAAANRQVFESLMQRMKETGVSSELRTSNIRIVDEAEVPRQPALPRRRLNLLLSMAIGSMFAVGLAFVLEYLDNRIKNPDEIKQHLGLPFLGLVPNLEASARGTKSGNNGRDAWLINDSMPPNFVESFRALRTNLLFSSASEGSRSIVVTSTGPGEGKSLVASNLAVALAMTGERVLLLDADMRKPRVHEIFGKPQVPGLSNVLVGTAKASESVHRTNVATLWVMPSGEHPPNPPELLGSKRCKDLLASLGEHFDWVIIDTPPVMAVTDAAVIAHRATGVLFVVGAEMTARGAAQRAVEQLEHAKAKFLGALLNRVDLEHQAYYYSQYYRREYSRYYSGAPPSST
jgi:succinoglycan biosynthesis transport protein ExoP